MLAWADYRLSYFLSARQALSTLALLLPSASLIALHQEVLRGYESLPHR